MHLHYLVKNIKCTSLKVSSVDVVACT